MKSSQVTLVDPDYHSDDDPDYVPHEHDDFGLQYEDDYISDEHDNSEVSLQSGMFVKSHGKGYLLILKLDNSEYYGESISLMDGGCQSIVDGSSRPVFLTLT